MKLDLQGRVALVTGGSRGIGAAICRGLAAEGARVGVGCSGSPEKAADVAAGIERDFGVEAVVLRADLERTGEITGMFDRLEDRLGPVDILVNNAAYCPGGPIESYSVEEWEKTFRINVTGTFIACKEHVRRLLSAGRKGKIVNLVSQAAFLGSTSGHLPYDASKGALVSMTRAIAREVAAKGINVNAVAPGMVRTEMVADKLAANLDKYLNRIPLNRIAEPEDIANAVVFLASAAADYMTGTTLDVTGGMLMR
ncbi:MAG TPA: 3-oxoacyl-ACP reductase family protein [Kiritimatiellia bacterium]|nr:3-oxoacyl-ACP reductase family protein [Kiritimatiellia bacterium]HRU70671.1 3-oxoacyl-ACP reductase family protein [Kiritimatiellia bacterium]